MNGRKNTVSSYYRAPDIVFNTSSFLLYEFTYKIKKTIIILISYLIVMLC